jgi:integrase
MAKTALTAKKVESLKPRPDKKHYDLMDAIVPGFGVRVLESGATYVLLTRYPGSRNPTRRKVAAVGEISLEQARERARHWLTLVRQGIDPKEEVERIKAAERQKRANTFEAVAEDFIAQKLPGERRGADVERSIRRDLIPAWGKTPIAEISRRDILSIIREKKASAPGQARNLLGEIKRLFTWAVEEDVYGLEVSPAEGIRARRELGEKPTRTRILTDAEMLALWRAAQRTAYPVGPAYQLLALTGLRLNEVADAQWSEFDLTEKIWTIPAARMKGREGSVLPHAVPITAEIEAMLARLPRGSKGEFVFSTTFGSKAVWLSQKVKERLDARMLRTLKAMARLRGDDPREVKLPHFTNHDIRRTVRSNLSRLGIRDEVAEAVLAHVRPGIKKNYDLHNYLPEKRDALEKWARRIQALGERQPTNVVRMADMRA